MMGLAMAKHGTDRQAQPFTRIAPVRWTTRGEGSPGLVKRSQAALSTILQMPAGVTTGEAVLPADSSWYDRFITARYGR